MSGGIEQGLPAGLLSVGLCPAVRAPFRSQLLGVGVTHLGREDVCKVLAMIPSAKCPFEGVGLACTSPFPAVHGITSIGCLFFSHQLLWL